MSKPKARIPYVDPATRSPIFSLRLLLSILLVAAGIAYVVIWTMYLRDGYGLLPDEKKPDPLIPSMDKLEDWNWLVGFGLFFLGLMVAAHPKTPLGRGRGVVVGMLGCFLLGLAWICTFYVFANKAPTDDGAIWLISDLGQLNLLVGIGFMAVGFTFATKWE